MISSLKNTAGISGAALDDYRLNSQVMILTCTVSDASLDGQIFA
jgi:hypothetical protein